MKNFILLIVVLFSNILSAQVITGLSVTQNNTNQIKTNLKVYLPYLGEFNSYNVTVNQNVITLSACYNMSGAGAVVNLENDFLIDIQDYGNYILKANIYLMGATTCDYNQLEDTATLNFSTPIQGTVSLAVNENWIDKQSIGLFPVPAKDQLNIRTSEKIENIKVYDATGKLLPISLINNKINTAQLKNGIYFIEIFTGKKIVQRKFVVEK